MERGCTVHKRPITLAGILGTTMLAAACASPSTERDPDVERPAAESTYTEELTRSVNSAGLSIFRAAAGDEKNTAISPFSIGIAFGMLDAGATEPVKGAIESFFEFPASGEERLNAFNALEQRASHSAEEASDTSDEDAPDHATVTTANRLFLDNDFEPREEFREQLARYFGAGAEVTPMSSDPQKAAAQINEWVADKTEDLITQLVEPGTFDDQSRLTLVNALYMKADWEQPFAASDTWEEPFTRADGSEVTVDMMHSGMRAGTVYQGDDALAVVLPYAYNELSMTVIVPRNGEFESVRTGLDTAWLDAVATSGEDVPYTLALPKFTVESATNLRSVLEDELGVDSLFGVEGLEGIGPDLYVSDAVHAAKVIVDEEGTEAAAATGIVAGATSAPAGDLVEIRADQPFLYVIRDSGTGAILFVGQVLDPS